MQESFLAIRLTVPEASELLPICQELLPLHTSLYMYLGNEKNQRNQSPHQNLTLSHQTFHVATCVHLAWGTERGADRTLVGAWIPPFINLYRFQSTSSGVFGLLELCVQDTVNIYDNEALSFEPQISIFGTQNLLLECNERSIHFAHQLISFTRGRHKEASQDLTAVLGLWSAAVIWIEWKSQITVWA